MSSEHSAKNVLRDENDSERVPLEANQIAHVTHMWSPVIKVRLYANKTNGNFSHEVSEICRLGTQLDCSWQTSVFRYKKTVTVEPKSFTFRFLPLKS